MGRCASYRYCHRRPPIGALHRRTYCVYKKAEAEAEAEAEAKAKAKKAGYNGRKRVVTSQALDLDFDGSRLQSFDMDELPTVGGYNHFLSNIA